MRDEHHLNSDLPLPLLATASLRHGKEGKSFKTERAARLGAVFALAGMFLLKLPLPAPPFSGFFLVLLLIVLGNVWCWALVDGRILAGRNGPGWRMLRIIWAMFIVLMLVPLVLLIVERRAWDAWPVLGIMWAMSWNMLLAGMVCVAGVGGLIKGSGFFCAKHPLPARRDSGKRDLTPLSIELSRRELLVSTTAVAPLIVTAATVSAGVRQAGQFRIRRIELAPPRLPDRLRGLTITHLSDLHVGRLFRPEHVPAMVDAVNDLKSDLLVVTGDLIDHSNEFLPAACDALSQLESRYGRIVIAGNHDLIDDPPEFLSYVAEREPHFLLDDCLDLTIGGEPLQVAGLFWSRSDGPRGLDIGHEARVRTALAGRDPHRFTIGLAHHPHAFDALANWGADLTLAGHTHGGQIMLTPQGFVFPIGAGSLMFRYVWGIYRRGQSIMNVSAGCGNWFPVRINAPAEIVQIRLV